MTRDEAQKIEKALEETDGAEWLDTKGPGPGGTYRTPKRIRFTPTIEIAHDGAPANAFNLRQELAAYLRRVAAYLEL